MNQRPEQPEGGELPVPGDDQEGAKQLMERINAAGVRKLGDIATVYGGTADANDAPDRLDEAQPDGPDHDARGEPVPARPEGPPYPPHRPEFDDDPRPRIYVASLGDLLVGNNHGAWIDADQDPDSLSDCIEDMLCASQWSTEQWAIHGVHGFHGLQLSGFEDIGRISRLAIGLQEHGEALARWVGYLGTAHLDEALATFAQAYRGRFDALNAYLLHLSETGQFARYLPAIPTHLLTADLRRTAASLPESSAELYIVESRDGGLYVFDASDDAALPEQQEDGGS
jgi:antirestriction protein